jgi:16S rRNA (guanine(966)-N(2))-methyltransferase RsmD
LRETLFNVLGHDLSETRFIDVFAGTGAIGIEALSRGASEAIFIENHPPAVALIRKNLESLKITTGATVMASDAVPGLERIAGKYKANGIPFDYVYIDPPYAEEKEYLRVLRFLGTAEFLSEDATVVAEHNRNFDPPEKAGNLQRVRVLKQGDAVLSFYRRVPSDNGVNVSTE